MAPIGNLRWLLLLAQDWRRITAAVTALDDNMRRLTW